MIYCSSYSHSCLSNRLGKPVSYLEDGVIYGLPILSLTFTRFLLLLFLSTSSQVEEFEISYNSLRILSGIYFELGGIPFSFMKLKNLTIETVFDKQDILGVACLLKSSPVVDTLMIYFRSIEGNMSGTTLCWLMPENAINFAKFLLKYGKGLQKMNLHLRRRDNYRPFDQRNDAAIASIKGFPRASANVKISKKFR
ncbi:hypothetical protein M0R45_033121 [Rubus argutus]|uniref:Uncharacterized protein n=1 Tax=Rubus argutus TaxID=59490 RepID=A0AAW1WIP8_RUBAR